MNPNRAPDPNPDPNPNPNPNPNPDPNPNPNPNPNQVAENCVPPLGAPGAEDEVARAALLAKVA